MSAKPIKKQIQIRAIAAVLFFLVTQANSFSQESVFRRHFIIAYDVSSPFVMAEKNCPAYYHALLALFSNKEVINYNEAYQDNLNVEKSNGLPFFDKVRDEITFFHFNVASSEFGHLRKIANKFGKTIIVSEFNKIFLKDKELNWKTFSGKHNASQIDYLDTILSIQPTPANFSGGVSMSNFVYPLVLDKIDTNKYAQEYILIILSDFLTGSMLGNKRDLDRVRDLYGEPYSIPLKSDSPVGFLKKKIDFLSSQYYKIDFFQYSFIPNTSNNPIGIISYKIKPKIGVLTPEDVSLFVDGDLGLEQRGYESQMFKTSETKIKFTHNKNLVPTELRMTAELPPGRTGRIIFDDIIASRNDSGNWVSKYTSDKDLMAFDSMNLTYYLPKLSIFVDSVIKKKNFDNLTFKYEFKTKYIIADARSLNFIFSTERELPIENIDYSTKAAIIVMYYLLPIIAIVIVLIFLANYGRPRKLSFRIDGYLDSYEKIDYKTNGKLLTPFKAWDSELQKGVDFLLVNGAIEYKLQAFPLNWNSPVYLKLSVQKIPAGFEMFVKHDLKDLKEFSTEMPTEIKKEWNNKLSFAVGIRQTDITKTISDPELVKFCVEAVIKDSVLFIKSELAEKVEYKFHLGADLSDVWVGFDPGTCGSCVAVGSSPDNLVLGEDKAKNRIIPSVLVFDKEEDFHQNCIEIPEQIYEYGTKAQALFKNRTRYKGFQSIKKLLGFRDMKEIRFINNNILTLQGRHLAGLLVKGLFNDVDTHFNRPDFNADEYKRNGKFNPLRAVVAIPNNSTASKIQDMVDCIASLQQFKEIRYVYEAEAVLFYYLSNYRKLCYGEASPDSETILVFDMGGSTINATILTKHKALIDGRPKYEIDLLGKIGYGIGGDTIDYCIIRFILSFTNEYPDFKGIDIFDKKAELADLAFQIKKEIIVNYNNTGNNYLITAYNLESFINSALGLTITIEEKTSEMYQYFLKRSGKYRLFSHPLFLNIIYNNVKDAVHEAVELSGKIIIDSVILSGRSTSFPMIKETVEKQLNTKQNGTKTIALELEESKVAVAKGACWFGINKNSVRLNNSKTSAAFGFKKTQSADQVDVRFHELVKMGCNFEVNNDETRSVRGIEIIEDDFAFDGQKVNFYQVMGKDAKRILSEEQKHKFNKIASIQIDLPTSHAAIMVKENDEVDCIVILNTGRRLESKGVAADQEIDEANEEHYTWIVK